MNRIAGIVCLEKGCVPQAHDNQVRKMCSYFNNQKARIEKVISTGTVCLAQVNCNAISTVEASVKRTKNFDLVCDGELYNREEVELMLENSDTYGEHKDVDQLIGQGYEKLGKNIFAKLRGPIAIGIYDQRRDKFSLARDRFGEKRLYYSVSNGHLYFASEISPVAKILPSLCINKRSLLEWTLYRNLLTGESFFENVFVLPPGNMINVDKGRIELDAYFTPIAVIDEAKYQRFLGSSDEEVIDEIEKQITYSVQDCVKERSDVGTFCSGGVDSSLVTALAAKSNEELISFHASDRRHSAYNELNYAQQVAARLGVELECVDINKKIFQRELARSIYV
ncbi:MAG: 7-cyano-7-deazaguanine synthase, partial [Desulfobacterales bacterium]